MKEGKILRTKSAILNFITDLLPQIILVFIGLIKASAFIAILGTELNGLYNNYVQIMTYLTIVDGGLASAIIYRLYKPIAEKDENKINQILTGSKIIFRIIAVIIFILGLIISFFVPNIISDNPFSFEYVQITFIIYLISSMFTYFTITNQALFEAHQKKYITNIVMQTVAIIKGIFEIIVINMGLGFIGILTVLIISNLTISIIIYIISRIFYKNNNFKSKEKDYIILRRYKKSDGT